MSEPDDVLPVNGLRDGPGQQMWRPPKAFPMKRQKAPRYGAQMPWRQITRSNVPRAYQNGNRKRLKRFAGQIRTRRQRAK